MNTNCEWGDDGPESTDELDRDEPTENVSGNGKDADQGQKLSPSENADKDTLNKISNRIRFGRPAKRVQTLDKGRFF